MLAAMARVLIAGATSAIAGEAAVLLARRGDMLYLLGRNELELERLRRRLGDAVVGWRVADLAETDRNAEHVAAAIEALGGLDIALVAHGLLGDQIATERDWTSAEHVLRTNLLSPISLLIVIANHFEDRMRGQIAVLSSVAGERGRPRNYTYGAAKAALTIYLQGLRTRLWRVGVQVHTFKLGPVDSPMTREHPKNVLFARPEAVARQLVLALSGRGRERYVPWYWAPIMSVVRRLPEPIFQRFSFLADR